MSSFNKTGGMETSVLEIQRAILKLQQQQQPMQFPPNHEQGYYGYNFNDFTNSSCVASELTDMYAQPPIVKPDPGADYGFGWPEIEGLVRSGVTSATTTSSGAVDQSSNYNSGVMNFAVSNSSCPPSSSSALLEVEKAVNHMTKQSSKKRKTLLRPPKPEEPAVDNNNNNNNGGKRAKKNKVLCYSNTEDEQIRKCNNNNTTSSKSKTKEINNSKSSAAVSSSSSFDAAAAKTDYIHVRARRGQATDSHSLAERVRRERISERMKYLQDLVPGCDKITGKAGMLDEIINYVQSLQRQVEFLSMKLASVSPTVEFNMDDDLLTKQIYAALAGSDMNIMGGFSSEMVNNNNNNSIQYEHTQPQQQQQQIMNQVDTRMIRRTISAPVPDTTTFLDSSAYLNKLQTCLVWDSNTEHILHTNTVYSLPPFQSQPSFSGAPAMQPGCLKMEM